MYHVKEKVLADTSAHINKASVFAELNSAEQNSSSRAGNTTIKFKSL